MAKLNFGAVLVLAAGVVFAASPPRTFRVIVNAANPVSVLTEQEVARIFLKKATRWPDGAVAIPIDQRQDSPVREQFSRAILGRDVGPVKTYWQQMIFSGRNVPPLEVASDELMLAQIRSAKGSVGYVSLTTELGSGIKELTVSQSDRTSRRR